MSVQSGAGHPKDSVISFSEANYEGIQPHQDGQMVERVLVDQWSSTNTTFQKLVKMEEELEACSRILIGFAGEHVEIRGAIDLRTTFGAGLDVKIVLLRFTVINAQASYNIILGQPTLNQLLAIVSTLHLCTKYLASLKIGGRRANPEKVGIGLRSNVHLLELDPRQTEETKHPQLVDNLKEIQISQRSIKTTKVGVGLRYEEEEQVIDFLRKNKDVFAIALEEMSRIDPNHRLSIILGAPPIAQKKKEKWAMKMKGGKRGNWEVVGSSFHLGSTLSNLAGQRGDDYTDLNKAYLNDPYPLPSIDRLVDGTSSFWAKQCRNHLSKIDRLNIQRPDRFRPGDDMVAKSTDGEQHCEVFTRVFDILRKHKLN
ncbi:hypothetical protein CR513_32209, partial [Mucuna pruriens]